MPHGTYDGNHNGGIAIYLHPSAQTIDLAPPHQYDMASHHLEHPSSAYRY